MYELNKYCTPDYAYSDHQLIFMYQYNIFTIMTALMSLAYLKRHLNEHQQFLNADPDSLSFELLRDAGPLFVCEASQQL